MPLASFSFMDGEMTQGLTEQNTALVLRRSCDMKEALSVDCTWASPRRPTRGGNLGGIVVSRFPWLF